MGPVVAMANDQSKLNWQLVAPFVISALLPVLCDLNRGIGDDMPVRQTELK